MATIGLDKLYYAKITEDTSGNETYEAPQPLAKAMTAELSVELAEATLYADDGAAEVVKEFQRILKRNDVLLKILVDVVDHTGKGSRLTASGRTGYQYQTFGETRQRHNTV